VIFFNHSEAKPNPVVSDGRPFSRVWSVMGRLFEVLFGRERFAAIGRD